MDGSFSDVRRLMAQQRLGVLSTVQPDSQPYASLVAIVASMDPTKVAFATLRATRKFTNICSEPRVALLLDDRANQPSDLVDAVTLTVLGTARELEGNERDRWTTALIARHEELTGFLGSPDCAVMLIEVERLLLVTRFQRVTELVVSGGVLEQSTAAAR